MLLFNMIFINIVIIIFFLLIIHHLLCKIDVKEGLENTEDTKYIPPPKDSSEYTAAEVAAQLEIFKNKIRAYEKQMSQLSSMNAKMTVNTVAIMNLQKAVADIEAEAQDLMDSQ